MTTNPALSLFDTPASWAATPREAVFAWILSAEFVTTPAGETQPLRESSAKVYQFMSGKFLREVVLPGDGRPGRAWPDITSDDIRDFLERNGLKRGIRNRYVRLLEKLFAHLQTRGIVQHNPARGLALKEPTRSGQHNDDTIWLTDAQQEAIIAALPDDRDDWKAQRNRAMIALVLGGGVKVGEVIRLPLTAVGPRQDDGSLWLTIPSVGAGRAHRTRVSPFASAILYEWIAARARWRAQGQILFPTLPSGMPMHPSTVYRQVAAIMTEAGIEPAAIKRRGARTLRNTFAIHELSEGSPAALVGEYLGHRADRSTRYYTALLSRKAASPRAASRPDADPSGTPRPEPIPPTADPNDDETP